MTAAILAIGTELTRGELHNRNAGWLADQMARLGHEVTEMVTVDDDDERIVATLSRLSSIHQVILCTGGLGPTSDDRTTACAASWVQRKLVRSEPHLERIREMFESRGLVMSDSNTKQADFPLGSGIMENTRGTAPGFFVDTEDGACRAFFMPGVPHEMELMFQSGVVPALRSAERPVYTARLRTFGMPEAEVNDRLKGLEEEFGVTIGYRASNSEIEVKVLVEASSTGALEKEKARAVRVADLIEERLGRVVYARGETSLAEVVGKLAQERGVTLGLAESCTGGLVSQLITAVPGASGYYMGGVCSYADWVKENVLRVSPKLIASHGAVSEEVACAMAEGARKALGADVTLSLTGIAGPGGGSDEKPVGLVHWAVSDGRQTIAKHRVFRGSRSVVQKRAAVAALWSLRELLIS